MPGPRLDLADKLVQALDNADVQAKIFEKVFKPVWEASMGSFGKGVADKVGEMLAEIQVNFDRKLRQSEDHAEATARACTLAEARTGNSRTQRRNRQRKAKSEPPGHSYSPRKLLELRPVPHCDDRIVEVQPGTNESCGTGVSNSCDAEVVHDVMAIPLQQRLANLEAVVISFCQPPMPSPDWMQWQMAVPADRGVSAGTLERQCLAVRRIQTAWRRHVSINCLCGSDDLERQRSEKQRNPFSAQLDGVWEPLRTACDGCTSPVSVVFGGAACHLCNACLESGVAQRPISTSTEIASECERPRSSDEKITTDTFVHKESFALHGAVSRTSRRLSSEKQKHLRARMDETIKVQSSVQDFTHFHDIDNVRAHSNAFFTIATFFPDTDPDDLGDQLRTSYRVRSGASMSQQYIDDAAGFDAKLRSMGVLGLGDEAHFFYSSVGALS